MLSFLIGLGFMHSAAQAITVSGRVSTTDGSSAAGFRVVVEQVGGELPLFTATTSESGAWSVSDPVLFGNIRITALKAGYLLAPAQFDRFTDVNITNGDFVASPLVPDIAVRTSSGGVLASGMSVVFPSDFPGAAQTITVFVRNNGNVPLTGIAYTFSGPQGDEFSLSSPALTTLPAGGVEAIHLRVVPSASGLRTAVLSIASNDPDQNPFTLALSTTGLPLSLLNVSTTADSGAGSLRAAVAQAVASSAPQSLTFDPALDGRLIRLDMQMSIPTSADLTIDARGLPNGLTVLDNGGSNRLFLINSNATLALGGLTMSGRGNGEDRGGILRNHGTLRLSNCTLTGGRLLSPQITVGGAVYNSGVLGAEHCVFTNNTASLGGSLYIDSGASANFTECSFIGNGDSSTLSGGAIISGGTLTLTRCQLSSNKALNSGSALFLSGPSTVENCIISKNSSLGSENGPQTSGAITSLQSLTMTGCTVSGNTAFSAGGLSLAGQAFISNTLISGNSAFVSVGGGVSSSATLAMTGCSILDNFARRFGGGLHLTGPSVLADCTIRGNVTFTDFPFDKTSTASGGGVFSNGLLTMTRCHVSDNRSQRGGGLGLEGQATLDQCSFSGNAALEGLGGGIFSNGRLTVTRSFVDSNTATRFGGGLFLSGQATLRHCTIQRNVALDTLVDSCGIYSDIGTTLLVDHCTVVENRLARFGGGIFQATSGTTTINRSIITDNGSRDLEEQDASRFKTESPNIIGIHPALTGPVPMRAKPLLAPIADYGGPTPTRALLPGSPARNAGTGSTATSDQRGFPIVGTADLGAYEAGTLVPNLEAYLWETLPAAAVQHTADADFDGDGQNNQMEWLTQTDATSADSFFRATVIKEGSLFIVRFPTVATRHYRLFQSDTLAPGSFTDSLLPPLEGHGDQQQFSVPIQGQGRFFRLEISP